MRFLHSSISKAKPSFRPGHTTTLVENLLSLSDPLAFVQTLFCQSHCTTVSGPVICACSCADHLEPPWRIEDISLFRQPQTDSVKASVPALHGPVHLLSIQPSGPRPQEPPTITIHNMGRLRKLSQSLKAAALGNHSNDSTQSFSRAASNGHTQVLDKDSPAQSPDLTATTFSDTPQTNPRTDRTPSRPTSMVYTPPSMEMGRDNHVEELVPVFRYAGRLGYIRVV